MASGLLPVFTVAIGASVFRSKRVAESSLPLLAMPRPNLCTSATPCTPMVLGISPTNLPLSTSTTITRVARAM